uniref:Transmembrane protein n=1 Tax=Salix viminalis TaxID=40686 RepID=A0A6N2M3T1_SALVM
MDKMLGLNSFFHPQILSFSGTPLLHPQPTLPPASFPLKISKKTHPRLLFAQTNNNNNLTQEPKEPEQEKKNGSANNSGGGGGGGGDALKQDQPPPLFDIKWGDLLLNPDPDNILAVGLTGLLSWASVQVLWQLFVIAFAILIAALKYSFVAALLIFILITLL